MFRLNRMARRPARSAASRRTTDSWCGLALTALMLVSASCGRAADPEATATPPQIADTPDYHGFFMLGDDVLFLEHMPMFDHENHMYQVILKASLPAAAMETVRQLRREHPDRVLNLINIQGEPMTLLQLKTGAVARFNATVYSDYSNDHGGTPGPVAIPSVPVTVEQVVFWRHFDYSFGFPEPLRYLLFGTPQRAWMTHLMTRTPDFQHILELHTVPGWLSPDQVQAGVAVNVIGLHSSPIHCSPPLSAGDYRVHFQGQRDTSLPVAVGRAVWFSTGNLLNPDDPCPSQR